MEVAASRLSKLARRGGPISVSTAPDSFGRRVTRWEAMVAARG
jgi:hypothetical protein